MKLRKFVLLFAVLPLLCYCGGKDNVPELPPPSIVDDGGGNGGGDNGGGNEDDEDDGGNGGTSTPAGEWEKNRGVSVTPSGTGWTSTVVREGIVFYKFSGTDPVSGKAQNVCAIDVDLANPNYEVHLTRTSPSAFTSVVHAAHNAIATMNAGYEAGSIYIRIAGKDWSALPNTTIGSTGVRNWKSEAAFFSDGKRSVHLRTVEELIRPYVSPESSQMSAYINKQRMYLYNDSSADIISSSPMLIDDFKPVGETFIDYSISNWSKLNTEEPQYHQRKRHPRSAVALTENNHFIMMTVDGRQTNSAEGMSAKELTRFFVKNFNPQYALNMDGGGSTAMCVEGLGNSSTHIVNVPIQDNVKGRERARDTHFMIVAK
ncbi:MAG: phosphodiester glycosidase family protein [Bacteroidales bacterium]|nr:phosphodiester glycosidase family protein [Bacteroidales bacterium]